MNVLHVAQFDIAPTGGAGRVSWHWREAFEARGHRFADIGPLVLGRHPHSMLYPLASRIAAQIKEAQPDLVLVHEPASAFFVGQRLPVVVFSHGVERRGWAAALAYRVSSGERISKRSRVAVPLLRLPGCDYGLRHADGVLVLNSEDYRYCIRRLGRAPDTTFFFRNGVDADDARMDARAVSKPTILFVGSWIARKGIQILMRSAMTLHRRGVELKWVLAGTGATDREVISAWPEKLRASVEVIPKFGPDDELDLMHAADVFVLPSFFEGQPLALLQAMAAGLPVITTASCGQLDVVNHGENGLLFAPGDDEALANLIEDCASQPALRLRLGAAARDSVRARSWTSVAGEVVSFVEGIYSASTDRDRGQTGA